MRHHSIRPSFLVIFFLAILFGLAPSMAQASPGFLVLAQDRGFVGNGEIREIVTEFQKTYSVSLALIGRDYSGFKDEYAGYAREAILALKQDGATEIVAIPLFVSNADPVLQRAKPLISAYVQGLPIQWAQAMSHSYLIGQVLLDRVEAVSMDPSNERLILLGIGAVDEPSEQAIKQDIRRLVDYVQRYHQFREVEVAVYYDRGAEGGEGKNKELKAYLIEQIAKEGRALIVPAFIGVKFDYSMALSQWLGGYFKKLKAVYQPQEFLPHPNVLVWLKKTANAYSTVTPHDIGVVIMPHGATQPWNDAVEKMLEPLKRKYPIEMAYGMGDAQVIQEAVSRMEEQEVKRIVFVRLYPLEDHFKDKVDYMLGVSTEFLEGEHARRKPPAQIRSGVLFTTFGGYEENIAVARILHERIMEISRDPARETVIILAHGAKSDETNAKWLTVMNRNVEWLRHEPHCSQLQAITAATVREDWSALREKAIQEVRTMIEQAAHSSRVLVIANRLYGPGPYEKFLDGLDYQMNGKGLLHPIITQWLDDGIQQTMKVLVNPMPFR